MKESDRQGERERERERESDWYSDIKRITYKHRQIDR